MQLLFSLFSEHCLCCNYFQNKIREQITSDLSVQAIAKMHQWSWCPETSPATRCPESLKGHSKGFLYKVSVYRTNLPLIEASVSGAIAYQLSCQQSRIFPKEIIFFLFSPGPLICNLFWVFFCVWFRQYPLASFCLPLLPQDDLSAFHSIPCISSGPLTDGSLAFFKAFLLQKRPSWSVHHHAHACCHIPIQILQTNLCVKGNSH